MTTTIHNIGKNLKQLEQHPNGLVYKFKKIGGKFVHTYCVGKMLKKSGLTPSMVINHTLDEILPYEEAQQKILLYEKAWSGEIINYEGCYNNVHYFAILLPIIENGTVVEIWGTAFDVTWNKLHEKETENTERLAMVGQLAAGVAHEIRNPLTSLKGFTKILQEMTREGDKLNYLTIMQDELDKIQQIVNEFMLLSKPSKALHIQKIDLKELVNNVVNYFQPQLAYYHLNIIVVLPDDIIAQGDYNLLKQIIINLLQNSIDASIERKKDIILSVKSINAYYYEIKVKDYGHGISKERQERLFQPFYTTKEKGTGLGLMVCKRIVDLHHGTIKIFSQKNVGTEVIVELPKKFR